MISRVIFTDMDGSLLDHHDYHHHEADALLDELEVKHIPVILVSSKTRAELLHWRKELNNHHPFIIENGAAVIMPAGYFQQQPEAVTLQDEYWVRSFTEPRQRWLDLIAALAPDYAGDFNQFAKMDLDTIMALTGLAPDMARLAAQREYGEPVHWTGSTDKQQAFIQALVKEGASVLQGGRFLHVSGKCDKGEAVRWLQEQYVINQDGQKPVSLAIGDSQNDESMLAQADDSLVIRSPVHDGSVFRHLDVTMYSKKMGPAGWNEGVRQWLQ